MNEKGIISYYNLFVVLFLTLSISISLLYNISRYRSEAHYFELLTVIQDDENMLYRTIYNIVELETIPSVYVDTDNNRITIELIDKDNLIYKINKLNTNIYKSSMGEIDVYVYIKDKNFKIIKWEYSRCE